MKMICGGAGYPFLRGTRIATRLSNLGILLTVLYAVASYGQGVISFQNRVTTTIPAVDAPVYNECLPGGARLSGTNSFYRAALLGGPTNAIPASWSNAGTLTMLISPSSLATWVTFQTGAAAGYVAVGTDHMRDSQLPYGSTGMFQVIAWQGTQTTWQDAFNAARVERSKLGCRLH